MATEAPYNVEPLDAAKHDRRSFDCGAEPLNRYFREQATQDMRRRDAACWVVVDIDRPSEVLGYYTLSSDSVLVEDLPALTSTQRKKLGPYPKLGAYLLGRLAVARSHRGRRLGESLLFDAISRCAKSKIPRR